MHYSGLIFFLLLAVQAWQMGNAECCQPTFVKFKIKGFGKCESFGKSTSNYWSDTCTNNFCGDLSTATPCCGMGKCNIFCCNCDNGCLPGIAYDNLVSKFGSKITIVEPLKQSIVVIPKLNNSLIATGNDTDALKDIKINIVLNAEESAMV